MARAWFQYSKASPSDPERTTASNYMRIGAPFYTQTNPGSYGITYTTRLTLIN